MSKRQREADEREMENSCATIIAELLAAQMKMDIKHRRDKQGYVEFIQRDNETGKTRTFMRVDVLCRIFDE